jgi:formylmethanofuran dehydrogenase subunit B
MNYVLLYLIIGLLITMLFEYVFGVIDKENEETKFDSYLERLLLIVFWGCNNISNYS